MADKVMSDEQVKELAATMKEQAKKEMETEIKAQVEAGIKAAIVPAALGLGTPLTKTNEVDPDSNEGKQLQVGRYLRALGRARMNGMAPTKQNIATYAKEFEKTAYSEAMIKSLSDTTESAGAAFITQGIAEAYIQLLANKTVIRSAAGVETFKMPSGTERFRKETAGTTASWGANGGTAVTASQPTYGEYIMTAKQLTVLVPVQNAWLKRADAGIDKMVITRMVTDAAVAEDLGFIRGLGNQYQPLGIYGQTSSSNIFTSNATVTDANIRADLTLAQSYVYGANVPYSNPGWIMSPQTFFHLKGRTTTTGAPSFPELADNMLLGAPVYVTSAILNTYGAGTDSEVYFGEFSKLIIGDTQEVDVQFIQDAAYTDASGNTVLGVSTLESVFRLVESTDIFMRYDKAFSVIGTVKWHA